MTIEEIPSPKEEAEVKVHRPTVNNRRIIVDADESAPRMVTRSMLQAKQAKQEIDFDGASRAWRKANPNRQR
jgi:vacuolar-type H+-ATPase subunit H